MINNPVLQDRMEELIEQHLPPLRKTCRRNLARLTAGLYRAGHVHLTQEETRHPVSTDFHFAAAVVGYGMLLHNSEHKGSLTYPEVRHLAEQRRGDDPGGTRAGFISLVKQTDQALATGVA